MSSLAKAIARALRSKTVLCNEGPRTKIFDWFTKFEEHLKDCLVNI